MSYDFNGTNQYLTTATTPTVGKPITLVGWVNGRVNATNILVANGRLTATPWDRVQLIKQGNPTPVGVDAQEVRNNTIYTARTTTSLGENIWGALAGIYLSATSRTAYLNAGGEVTNTTDAGTAVDYESITIGARINNGAYGLFLNGLAAEVAMWNIDLNVAEINSLAKGFKPSRIRPQNLVFYAPLIRDLQDTRGGRTITNNNTATVAAHPRVY